MSNPTVRIVWDNADPDHVHVPPEMGEPRADQMRGTALERLAELCGRICYDSLGKGRNSEEYHRHIREVGHLSVYEHCVFTVEYDPSVIPFPVWFNRPSLYVDTANHRVTMNLRHVLEWRAGSEGNAYAMACQRSGSLLWSAAAHRAPAIMGAISSPPGYYDPLRLVEPETDNEHWVSLYIGGVSRNLTHELVRHGDWTAFSQRSTRYCDESETPIVWHPELKALAGADGFLEDAVGWVETRSRQQYQRIVTDLMNRGCDRKTARGAARGVLPSALGTELVMSASVAQWRHVVRLRAHESADGEIRRLASVVGSLLRLTD